MVSVFVILPLHGLRGRDGQTVIEESRGVTEVTFHLKALLFYLECQHKLCIFSGLFFSLDGFFNHYKGTVH